MRYYKFPGHAIYMKERKRKEVTRRAIDEMESHLCESVMETFITSCQRRRATAVISNWIYLPQILE